MISKRIKDLVDARVASDVATINARFNKDLAVPRVVYDVKGACGGYVSPKDNYSIIHLNPALFIDNEDEMINETAPHELAHWAEHKMFGEWEKRGSKRSVHGTRWKNIMNVLRVNPSRCHNMDMSSVKTKRKRKYEYACGCQSHTLSSVRHNRILRGASYTCNKCGTKLTLKKALGQVSYAEAKAARSQKRPTAPKAPASHKRPTTGTKKERAQAIFDTSFFKDRATIMDKFMKELDMTKAGASTYWYNIDK